MSRIAVVVGGDDYDPTPDDLVELWQLLELREIDVVRTHGDGATAKAIHDYARDVWRRERDTVGSPGVRLLVALPGTGPALVAAARARKLEVRTIGGAPW